MIARYGIDAPRLLAGFVVAGMALAMTALGLGRIGADAARWGRWVDGAQVALALAVVYPFGMAALMLRESLVGKLRHRDRVLDLIDWRGNESVLDVGCGRGLMLVGAAQRLIDGVAVGVDIWHGRDQARNSDRAALANARAKGVEHRVQLMTADMRDLPFPDAAFAVVLSSWAVHNIEAAEGRAKTLAEMVRVLRPGGTILLTDIVNRREYLAEFRALGLDEVSLFLPSVWRDRLLRMVSFGAFGPFTVIARKTATARP